MTARYFVASRIEEQQSSTTLTGSEAQHLLRVMRAGVGDQVILFDGSGAEFLAQIVATDRHEAECTILERHRVDRERPDPIILAVSLPKGDRQRVLIEKAVEIGVSRLIPIRTDYSSEHYSAKSVERWERYVIEASKQCGRNVLMEIDPPRSLQVDLLPALRNTQETETSAGCASTIGWIAHPYAVDEGDASMETWSAASSRTPPQGHSTTHWIAIGPEGGFSEQEVRAAKQMGWHRLDLGPRILRVETAAIVAVSRFDRHS